MFDCSFQRFFLFFFIFIGYDKLCFKMHRCYWKMLLILQAYFEKKKVCCTSLQNWYLVNYLRKTIKENKLDQRENFFFYFLFTSNQFFRMLRQIRLISSYVSLHALKSWLHAHLFLQKTLKFENKRESLSPYLRHVSLKH